MNINERIYVITPSDEDDHIAVHVIPATVRRIVRTEETDADGKPIETTEYMVGYDGEGPCRSYHRVTEGQVVSLAYCYNHGQKVGDAVLAAIAAQQPKPPVEVGPPPAMEPAPRRPDDPPF